ncbi:hypothetical protein GCM10027417_29360 [Glutamicibacter endophyticus]|uniref:hypothetical protein n=1 Tax=Glutamicibacter sp. PS TaxID=3075634 RepID=UPI00283CAD00|nr:hypothetical protein [Glutamicibacter sp. PS]MDR4534778.1 hypothetical protein [Glutamicibacter sp. PS]
MSYTQRSVKLATDGLVIDDRATLHFADIRRSFIYQLAAGDTELTYAEFILDNGHSVEINSAMDGWKQVLPELPRRLPGLVDER